MKLGFHKAKKAEGDFPPIPAPSGGGRIPADRVASLSSQGLSEPEIIRTLRTEGYSPMEVDTAMKDALRSAVRPGPPRMAPALASPSPFGMAQPEPQRRQLFSDEPDVLPAAPKPAPAGPMMADEDLLPDNELELPRLPGIAPPPRRRPASPFMPPQPVAVEEDIEPMMPVAARPTPREDRLQKRREFEEIAEGVVDERIGAAEKRMDDLADRVKELNVRVNNLQQALDRMQGERRGDIAEITDRIESYRQGMSDVSSRMESVERTMKDSMTPMMQSLRSLSDAVKAFKETKR